MEIYLVGGAVRDTLLGLTIKERDWVVVGATPNEMYAQGYKKVGQDFPVFLHPQTHEEYALARTERKTGKGYTQFVCFSDPSVTLLEDLQRRDLTINAIAQAPDGKLIDPYGGVTDLERGILRHVSSAFTEDPVRILRVARFAARFGNFHVDIATNELMRKMLISGEVDALVPERVWQEFQQALLEPHPYRFIEVLDACGVLERLFPMVFARKHEVLKALHQIVKTSMSSIVRFAAMLAGSSKDEVSALCKQYRIPKKYRELAILVVSHWERFTCATELDNETSLCLLEKLDAFRRPERFEMFLLACGINAIANKHAMKLNTIYKKIIEFKISDLAVNGKTAEEIQQLIHQKRLEAI